MKNILKATMCLFLCVVVIFSFAGCSSNNEITEENVTQTVENATIALKEFDKKKLEKYVDSKTLSTILGFAEGHDQFAELGKSIFENLEIEITSIDLANKTVTVDVKNKKLNLVASDFTSKLLSDYTTLQLLTKLKNDAFLDDSLSSLQGNIANVSDFATATVTLNIKQGKKNLVLSFDENAEDAVSGGALTAINSIIG